MPLKRLVTLALPMLLALPAAAQLRVEITSGITDPVPIAIVPFDQASTPELLDVAAVVQQDLERSGRFRAMPRVDMIERPSRAADAVIADWRTARNDYLVVGRALPGAGGAVQIDAELVNLATGQRIAGQRFVAPPGAHREAAHRISDLIHEKILGIAGAFATRIAYVSVDGNVPSQRFRLVLADADGENARTILESALPIMSPAWSPDGESLAYVSFESRAAAVYVQQVRSGERRRVSAQPGINGAPVYSPDGRTLALTLSGGSGNLDIHLLELASGRLRRLTEDAAIDTEPAFSPDGQSVYFTSDRAGNPQVYRVGVTQGGAPKRVSFTGGYNARPRVSADGRLLAMVTLVDGAYRVAVQELGNGTVRVLSKGRLDESPSFAPNSASLLYAGREGGQGVLSIASVDGLSTQRLRADQGEVRDPAWGPWRP